MIDPQLVEAALLAPGHCSMCGTHGGRMVDLMFDNGGFARVYLCEANCAPAVARLLGWADEVWQAEAVRKLEAYKENEELLMGRISALEWMLEQAQARPDLREVSGKVDEVLAELQRRKGGRPPKNSDREPSESEKEGAAA
jgi:hypothetical protein